MAKSNLHVLYIDCLKHYVDSMQKLLSEVESFFDESEMERHVVEAKCEAVQKVHHVENSILVSQTARMHVHVSLHFCFHFFF